MRVILLKDVEKVGKEYDVKDVSNGYARNFLIPQGLVKPATEEAMKWLETQKEIRAQKAEEELKKIQELATTIDGQEIIMPVKVGDEGQLFETIGSPKISERLKEMGFDIKKTQIDLPIPIKEPGEYPVKIKLEHNLEAEIKIIVTKEEKLEKE